MDNMIEALIPQETISVSVVVYTLDFCNCEVDLPVCLN